MRNTRLIIFIFIILSLILLASCSDDEVNNQVNPEQDLQKKLTDLEYQVSVLEAENERLKNDNNRYLREKEQQEIEKIATSNGKLEYDYHLVEAELNKSWQEIELLRETLNKYKENKKDTSATIHNMYNPYTIKVGETYAGLTVEYVSKYEGEPLSYNINFSGVFQVTGKLEYIDTVDKGYFIHVDGLENMPYQINNLTYPIVFYIGEPEELKEMGIEDGDIITATFTDYTVQSIPGKPIVDRANLLKILDISKY